MKREQRYPEPLADLSPAAAFGRAGAAEWAPRRTQYRAINAREAAQ
ncbi:MAG: hypothetical protein GKR94_07305 [Gammaproteobacteria bacterium]|nr:hypothetical protein [Gammaproteobacteria bacterium]